MDDRNFYRDLKKSRKRTGNRKRRRFFKEQIDSDDFDEKFDFGYNESASLNGRDGLNSKKKLNRRKRTPRPDKQVSLPPELGSDHIPCARDSSLQPASWWCWEYVVAMIFLVQGICPCNCQPNPRQLISTGTYRHRPSQSSAPAQSTHPSPVQDADTDMRQSACDGRIFFSARVERRCCH